MCDRFEEWTDKTDGERSEYYVRDRVTGEEASFDRIEDVWEWKAFLQGSIHGEG